MKAIKTFMANVAHAVRTHEMVKIGGGIFNVVEVQDVLNDYKAMCEALKPKAIPPASTVRHYLVVGVYESSGQRWADSFDAASPEQAEEMVTDDDIRIAAVIELVNGEMQVVA